MAPACEIFVAAAALSRRWRHTRRSTVASTRPPPIHSDGYSYYVYLPSLFIYHDATLEALGAGVVRRPLSGLHRHPPLAVHRPLGEPASDRHRHADGAVLSSSPICSPSGRTCRAMASRSTTSTAPALAAIAYFLLGLAILRRLLRRQFSDGVVLATADLHHLGHEPLSLRRVRRHLQPRLCVLPGRVSGSGWSSVVGTADGRAARSRIGARRRAQRAGPPHQRDLRAGAAAVRDRPVGATCRRAPRGICAIAGARSRSPPSPASWCWRRSWRSTRWATGALVRQRLRDPRHGVVASASPHLFGVLFSTQKGLFFWSPLLLLSVAGVFVATGQRPGAGVAGSRVLRAPDMAHCELAAVAVRRQLWPSRLHRRLRARRAVHRLVLRVGGAPPADAVPLFAIGATRCRPAVGRADDPVLDRRAAVQPIPPGRSTRICFCGSDDTPAGFNAAVAYR